MVISIGEDWTLSACLVFRWYFREVRELLEARWHGVGLGAVITVVEFVELIRGKVLVYRVVDSEFYLHDD